jgi:hypothetical protein
MKKMNTQLCRERVNRSVGHKQPWVDASAEVTFSGLQNVENEVKEFLDASNYGFHNFAKVAFPVRENAKNIFTGTLALCFMIREN